MQRLKAAKATCAKRLKLKMSVSKITGQRQVRVNKRDLKKLERCLERELSQ